MTSFTQVFGGGTLDPAQPSYKSYTASTSIASVWPIEAAASNNVVAAINDISFTVGALTFTLPPANQVSVGYNAVFNNIGANAFTVLDNGASVLLTATSGAIWTAYVVDNTTASGAYRVYQNGAGSSGTSAATLAGLGIKAITTTLNQEYPTAGFNFNTTPQTLTVANRAALVVWSGGVGVFNFSALATLTAGWFVNVANQGTSTLTITPPSGLIDGNATKILYPGDSAIVITDGTNMYTIGYGQSLLTPLPINRGGTAATTAALARTNLDVPSTLDAFTYVQMFS